jgi:glycosyltransferase involved in cell wall biosynthesis
MENPKMDIAYVTVADLTSKQGAVEHIIGVSQGLAELGNLVHLIAGTSSRDFVPTFSPNLIYHLAPIAGFSPPKAVAVLARHALGVIRQKDVDIVYLRTFPMDYLLFTRHLIRMRVPYVCELNTITDTEYRAKGQRLRGMLYRFWEGRTLAKSLGWLPVTQEICIWAERISRTRKPFVVAGNGVAVDAATAKRSREDVRRTLGVPQSMPVLVMAGFSRPWQGVDRALALLAELPESSVELWLVGAKDDTDREYIETMASKYGVGRSVRIFPWLSVSNTADLVAAADVGIGPLAWDRNQMTEAQPLKVRFYLALGLPVLINYHDPKLPGDLPFVSYVPSNEPKALASGVEKLLYLSLDERGGIRTYAVENLSWKAIASKTEAFLARLLVGRC